MTEYRVAVLRAVGLGPEPVGWYKIEQRLSREPLDEREHLPAVLTMLEQDGLITREADGRVWLTEAGRAVVAARLRRE
jgi:hypothetical protein